MEYNFIDDFDFAVYAMGIPESELCTAIGVSRTYLNRIRDGKAVPSSRLLESLYQYIYKAGGRLNLSWEEILNEEITGQLLFHGSRDGLTKISAHGSRPNCDFGNGFYMGQSYFQAASFISDTNGNSVYVFEFDEKDLKGVRLDCSLDWMLLICYYRGMLGPYKGHPKIQSLLHLIEDADYIVAPIADNKMFQIMGQFGSGDITSVQAIHALSASGLGEQVVLKTEKAIGKLNTLKCFYLCQDEKNHYLHEVEERAGVVETKLHLAKREFRTQGQFIDEVFQ